MVAQIATFLALISIADTTDPDFGGEPSCPECYIEDGIPGELEEIPSADERLDTPALRSLVMCHTNRESSKRGGRVIDTLDMTVSVYGPLSSVIGAGVVVWQPEMTLWIPMNVHDLSDGTYTVELPKSIAFDEPYELSLFWVDRSGHRSVFACTTDA